MLALDLYFFHYEEFIFIFIIFALEKVSVQHGFSIKGDGGFFCL